MYVQIPSSYEGPVFHQKLARILAEKGFRLHLGRSYEEPSKATYVLDARGLLTGVWSQNALIDPEEALRCGYAVSADHPITNDQRQYSVVVRAVPFASSRAGVIFSELREQLLQHGYGVSDYQQPCKRLS